MKGTCLNDYMIAVLVSEGHVHFLDMLVDSLRRLSFNTKGSLVIGDAGLKEPGRYDARIMEMPYKDYGSFPTQSGRYRNVIDNRVKFLVGVAMMEADERPILQLDADTMVLRSDFPHVDPDADMVLTVRHAEDMHVLPRFKYLQAEYPNLGVVFWNKPHKLLDFWAEWQHVRRHCAPMGGQYEQSLFLQATEKVEYSLLNIQHVPCITYNCYRLDWLGRSTRIVHFKGGEGRAGKHSTYANPAMVERVREIQGE